MSQRFLKLAVVYLVIGACLGLYMGINKAFTLVPVHAHLLLAGWVSLALAGLIYHLFPAAAASPLAKVHFWLHNLALPVFMIGLAVMLTGNEAALPAVAGGATVLLAGLVVFAVNELKNVD